MICICRDSITGREIARGSIDEMHAFQRAFGLCVVEMAPA